MVLIPEPLYYFRRDDDTLYKYRVAEMEVSDVHAPYKNNLLSEEGVVDTMAALLLRNANGLLRWTHYRVRRRWFRLTQWHQRVAARSLRHQPLAPKKVIPSAYDDGIMKFGSAHDAQGDLVSKLGEVKYVQR